MEAESAFVPGRPPSMAAMRRRSELAVPANRSHSTCATQSGRSSDGVGRVSKFRYQCLTQQLLTRRYAPQTPARIEKPRTISSLNASSGANSSPTTRPIDCVVETLSEVAPDADFSDRGRPFQSDRGRRFSVIADALGCAQAECFTLSQSSTISLKRLSWTRPRPAA